MSDATLVSTEIETVLEEVKEVGLPGTHIGQVKWFNPRLGYGFITVVDGEDKGKDIFAHHSGIKPTNSNYKTLEKGEYIQFNVIYGQNGIQAVEITGIKGGPLMCDFVTTKNPITQQMPSLYNTSPPPPPPPGGQYNPAWQPAHKRVQPPAKNKLKYSKEGRDLMKTMKAGRAQS
jgi:cold shock CspA family protein